MRSIFVSGGGPQARNDLERLVIHRTQAAYVEALEGRQLTTLLHFGHMAIFRLMGT